MKGTIAEPLFALRGRNKISSSPLLVDANEDGWPEVFVGGPVIRGLSWDGSQLPGWPRRGGRPFASSAAYGDITGDHRGSILIGCDDGRVYAFHVDGDRRAGWPISTGKDVFSTPALSDLDQDGCAEVVVGSDDGSVYIARGDGTISSALEIPNRPFVSASPTLVQGDSAAPPEIVVGAWDGGLYRAGNPVGPDLVPLASADHVIWSSATAFHIQNLGQCLTFSADQVYLINARGAALPGWPRRTGSWMASSPIVAELDPGAGYRIIVGAERLYLWDLFGHPQAGWPRDCGDFVWASPLAFDVDGDGRREVISASWDGRIYAFRADGSLLDGFPLWAGGAVFATPAVAPLPSEGGILVSSAWDGSVRGWRLPEARFGRGDWLQFRGNPARTGAVDGEVSATPRDPAPLDPPASVSSIEGAHVAAWPEGRGLPRVVVEGTNLSSARRCMVEYAVSGRGPTHSAPVVRANGQSVGVIQALRRPHRVRYHISYMDATGHPRRWPEDREGSFFSTPIWLHRRPREGAVPAQPASKGREPARSEQGRAAE